MKIKKSVAGTIFDTSNAIFLIAVMIIMLYPFWHIIAGSLSDSKKLIAHSGLLLKPAGFSFDAYKEVIMNPAIKTGYANTIFYVGVGTAFNIFMSALGAYGLSRKDFYWKKYLMIMVVITMFFSGGLIPNYLLVQNLGLLNTRWALILPTAISAWNLIIMRTAFMKIPDSLEESAKIDGGSDFYILFRIVIPLALPTIAVMILYYSVSHWNAWFGAMIYLRNRSLYPLQLFLREILIANSMESMLESAGESEKASIAETLKYAIIMVSTLPILFAYPFLQKYFVKGIMVGAVKG